ncbi:MAG: RsiV family protein [Gammaproteobacteria bacterium]
MQRLLRLWLLSIIACCLVLTPAFADDDNDDNTATDDKQVYEINSQTIMISTLKFQYGRPRIVVKSIYPQLESHSENQTVDDFNRLVTDTVQDEIAAFKMVLAKNKAVLENGPQNPNKTLNNLYVDYNASVIRFDENPIISIRFTIQGSMVGAAHPYHYHRTLNYDLNTGEKIELSDLFKPGAQYLGAFANYTSNYLLRYLKDNEMVMNGTAPIENNFKNWNIKPNGILITIEEGQAAPYVNGAQTILVPYTVLKRIMSSDSVLADCLNHQKKCERNNLLTGGFIDTAAASKKQTNWKSVIRAASLQ